MVGLQEWTATVRAAGAVADDDRVASAGADLLARWAEPHRRYHDAEHLTEVLDAVARLEALAHDAAAVRLAAWFHDAVHAGRPGDDERASADLAAGVLEGLGVPADRARQVRRLVLLTITHDPAPDDADGAVLCDADLAILAAVPERYARYARAVREEYAHVPDPQFHAGRAAVLRSLVAAPRLYRTEPAHALWEAAARANVAGELARLEG